MNRNSSFFWVTDELSGEDGESETGLSIDDDVEEGKDVFEIPVMDNHDIRMSNFGMADSRRNRSTQSETFSQQESIRFQVVVWHIGDVDVLLGHVPMKFRVTLFWNDKHLQEESMSQPYEYVWTMQGRQLACLQKTDTAHVEKVDVPPLSILNAVSFDIIGAPEVALVREDTRLMRWTCMYSAVLLQKSMRVDKFPHDYHDIVIELAILAHRGPGRRWDKNKWKLKLATESDSQGSTSVPHGLMVDHVHIPGFNYRKDGLVFEFVPHKFGPVGVQNMDDCLQVKLTVFRESGHYDKNIMPLMGMLNIIGITCIPRNFAPNTASTELMLSIAFVEIGFRLFIDTRLPSVGYQIKMQRILNQCFRLLIFLVLESNVIYFLVEFRGWAIQKTMVIDFYTAVVAFLYTIYMIVWYYSDMYALLEELNGAPSTKQLLPYHGIIGYG